ncbi:MAG: Panacea domain-containing protein [Actinomycetota bacterium]|nr:Panacea domain-containing protein [Actinomycetota bacterium]
MANLRDVLVYFCKKYPHPGELSNARLTKMVYLADWRSAIERGRQLSDVEWYFNHYGPYVKDVLETARADDAFVLRSEANVFGADKTVIGVKPSADNPTLNAEDQEILDFVIHRTERLYWGDFLKLVYSTYPILTQSRYTYLNLGKLAREYAEDKGVFEST